MKLTISFLIFLERTILEKILKRIFGTMRALSIKCLMTEELVKHNIESNKLLKDLNKKVNFRYTWVTKKTLPDDCSRRLTDLVRK